MILEDRSPDAPAGGASGFFPGGKYWYAKRFIGMPEDAEQTVMVEFEGVYMDSTVYLNGEKLGGHIYGYTNFFVDLTGKIRVGEENELLVEVDNTKQPNARWYTGSGIYRSVWLWRGNPIHIPPQGVRIKALSADPAMIALSTEVSGADQETYQVTYQILDDGKVIAAAEGKQAEVTLPDAKLWSSEHPYLYTVRAILSVHEKIIDQAEETFGIRVIDWNAEKGLTVNGETVKLKGGCIHHDHGILGACSFEQAELRRIQKLKDFGFNAIRFSHYPAGKTMLEVCDRLGMYVLDETFDQWRRPKSTYDYASVFDQEWEKDINALADKDFNHPSVIMYCIGNEIMDTGRSYGPEVAAMLANALRHRDGTRPVTIANNAPMSIVASAMEALEGERHAEVGSLQINELITAHPELAKAFEKGTFTAEKLDNIVGKVFDQVDICGNNYAHEFYKGLHRLHPDRLLLSAETFPQRMASNWKAVEENTWCIGDFHWTAWDYLGETGVGLPVYGTKEAPFSKPYPCLTAACGSFDLSGNPEAAAYYAAILWGKYQRPFIAVRPVDHSGEDYNIGKWRLTDAIHSWTWNGYEGREADVTVYSPGYEVELRLNGAAIGKKSLTECRAQFSVPYQVGKLEVVSYTSDGTVLGIDVLETAEEDIRLSIEPEQEKILADISSILFVPIRLRDGNGRLNMQKNHRVCVHVEGEGQLIALGSANPETMDRFDQKEAKTWHGEVLAIIRSTGKAGKIKISVNADTLDPVTATVQAG